LVESSGLTVTTSVQDGEKSWLTTSADQRDPAYSRNRTRSRK
jgi:hypothetical protein